MFYVGFYGSYISQMVCTQVVVCVQFPNDVGRLECAGKCVQLFSKCLLARAGPLRIYIGYCMLVKAMLCL